MKMLPVIFLLGAFLLGAFLLGAKLGDFYGIQLGRNWGVFYWEHFMLFCAPVGKHQNPPSKMSPSKNFFLLGAFFLLLGALFTSTGSFFHAPQF